MKKVFQNIRTPYQILEIGSIYMALLSLVMFSSSCKKVLDIETEGSISGDIFTNEENFTQALAGAYFSLGGIYDGVDGGELFGGDFILIATLLETENQLQLSLESQTGSQFTDFEDKNINVTNTRVQANWRRAYEVLNVVNNIISQIDALPDGTAKNKIHGEALAIRGILYFELVRFWGPEYSVSTLTTPAIPLVLKPVVRVSDIELPTKSTVAQVYTQVKKDLEDASTLLKAFGKNDEFLSYYSCQAYLMRMSLHMDEFGNAANYASNILIDTGTVFSLASTPMAAFNNSSNSTEDIFAIQQTFSNNSGSVSSGTGLTNYESSLSQHGNGVIRIVSTYLDDRRDFFVHSPKFYGGDLRGTMTLGTSEATTSSDIKTSFYETVNTSAGIPRLSCSKYMREDRVIPVVRLAEVYLSHAEAIYEQNPAIIDATALSELNTIRMRAGIDAIVADSLSSPAALRDSIVIERKRELLFEGSMFHDLKRWGEEINGTPATDARFILPIPQSETDTWN